MVARQLGHRGVEVDLGLGWLGEPPVAPPDLHVAADSAVGAPPPVPVGTGPVDPWLTDHGSGHREGLQLEPVPPVPRAGDAEAGRRPGPPVVAQHEVGRAADPQQAPQHRLGGQARRGQPVGPPGRRGLADRTAELEVGRPGGGVGIGTATEGPAQGGQLVTGARTGSRGKGGQSGGSDAGPIEATELPGCHRGVPVAPVPVAGGCQQSLEDPAGGGIGQDVRLVLAADQVDVVDAKVDGCHLVPRWPSSAGPLDRPRGSVPQAVGSLE